MQTRTTTRDRSRKICVLRRDLTLKPLPRFTTLPATPGQTTASSCCLAPIPQKTSLTGHQRPQTFALRLGLIQPCFRLSTTLQVKAMQTTPLSQSPLMNTTTTRDQSRKTCDLMPVLTLKPLLRFMRLQPTPIPTTPSSCLPERIPPSTTPTRDQRPQTSVLRRGLIQRCFQLSTTLQVKAIWTIPSIS